MPLGEEAAVVVVEAALELAVKAARSPLERVIHRIAGRKVLIVGPRNTGKTSFANYMRFGILADEETRVVSEDEETFSTFSVETARGQRLSARFRYVKTVPGELHIVKQARLLRSQKPHVCVLMFDAETFMPPNNTDDSEIIVWFRKFSRMLVAHFARASETEREKVRFIIILNKSDKVSASVMQQARKRLSHYLDELLTQEFSNHMRTTPILPCCMIDSSSHSKHRDIVIRRLLADLQ